MFATDYAFAILKTATRAMLTKSDEGVSREFYTAEPTQVGKSQSRAWRSRECTMQRGLCWAPAGTIMVLFAASDG